MRVVAYLVAWLSFLAAAVGLAARYLPVENHAVLVVAAFSPYLMAGAAVSAALTLLTHKWWAAGVSIALTAVVVAVLIPRFVGSKPIDGPSVPVRVLTANVRLGNADPATLANLARERADLLILQELTPELANELNRRGLESDFPYTALAPRPEAAGVGIWSRYPIDQSSWDSGFVLDVVTVSVHPPGAASDVIVLGAHLVGPWPQAIDGWRDEMAKLPRTLNSATAAAGRGAVIAAGDFNATADMLPFRALLRGGFRDAAEQAGAGLTPSYPADQSIPPLIGIDHVLTYQSSASDVATVRIPGSDHLGLAATVHVPG